MSEARRNLQVYLKANWRTVTLALVAGLGAIVLVALVHTQATADRARDEALQLQSHSYEVMIRVHALAGTLAGAEAALGRYVISGEKQLGQQYSAEWMRAGNQIDTLETALRDNPVQLANIVRLRDAYARRGSELADAAGYSRTKRNMAALGRYYQLRESPALREVDDGLDRIINSEYRLLSQRKTAATRTLERSNALTNQLALFGLIIVGTALVLGWLTVDAIGQRFAADAEAQAERERAHDLQRAVGEATAQLRQEAHEREEAEARLRQMQKMEAVGQLTGGIAHDFNNMLAVVLGGLELARRNLKSPDGDALRHLENAMEGANRAAALTRRLLAFARSEPVLPQSVEAATLVAGMSDLLDRTLGETITFDTRDAGLGWHAWVDRHQLENAVLNLAVNARDAMDGRGRITIVTGGTMLAAGAVGNCAGGEYVTLAVIDAGCGMTPDVIERVFEPFFTTKPVGKGTGLGLSQIFGFMRQAGGEIAIDSTPGEGTTVTLYLPRHGADAEPVPAEPASVKRGTAASGLEVLVVEDDPRVLAATLTALEELGHAAIGCPDPLQAPAAIEAMAALDLIITDVLMPGQTGPEMIAALKPRIAGVAVLFFTGYAGEAGGAETFGEYPVLRKPFTIHALEQAIGEAISPRDRFIRRTAAAS